jgi:formate/nitrite transporter
MPPPPPGPPISSPITREESTKEAKKSGGVFGAYVRGIEGIESLVAKSANKMEGVAAFGLSKFDKLLDDGDDTQPTLTVRQPVKAKEKHDDHAHPKEMTELMVDKSLGSGEHKVNYALWQNVINGLCAGAYISIGAFLASIVGGGCTEINKNNPGLGKWIFALVFPVGLYLTTMTGAELVTGSFSTVGMALVAGIFKGKQRRAIINLSIIYWTNFLGCLIMVGVAMGTAVFEKDPYRSYLVKLAEKKVHQPFFQAFMRGVMCNFLVSMATMFTFASPDVVGKAVGLWPLIMAFVAMGMDHSVANMWFCYLGLWLGADYSPGEIWTGNIIPVTIGNFVGSQIVSITYAARYNKLGVQKKNDDHDDHDEHGHGAAEEGHSAQQHRARLASMAAPMSPFPKTTGDKENLLVKGN